MSDLSELCKELLLLRAAHSKYFAQREGLKEEGLPACLLDYEKKREENSEFMATISDFRVDCAIEYGRVLAERFAIMRRTQEREAALALVELRGTPYSGPTQQSERNKIET